MENFCKTGKLEHKNGYDVCRGEGERGELRYDLTEILPGNQTSGHYHLDNEPELYEVRSGQAMFLTQSRDMQKTYLIEAKEGEKVIIPPDFSMRTINPSAENKLIISNWINNRVKNDYNAFKNPQESRRAGQEPIKLTPKELPKELENLDFLSHPEKYKDILTIEKLYQKT